MVKSYILFVALSTLLFANASLQVAGVACGSNECHVTELRGDCEASTGDSPTEDYVCTCAEHYHNFNVEDDQTGGDCEEICPGNTCKNGTCLAGSSSGNFTCDCDPNYVPDTDPKKCVAKPDPCANNKCSASEGNGSCAPSSPGATEVYTCTCKTGFHNFTKEDDMSGGNCEEICPSGSCDNGKCKAGATASEFTCTCDSGFVNPPTGKQSCIEGTDACSSKPCGDGGDCSVSDSDYKCECNPQFKLHGATAEGLGGECVAICGTDTCLKGKCKVESGDFVCYECDTGFKLAEDKKSCVADNSGASTMSGFSGVCTVMMVLGITTTMM